MDWESGGGFMNDSIADEPQHLTNSVSVATEERSKSICSVSVSQVKKLTKPNDGGLVIYGKKIYHVNLIAQVHELIEVTPQKIQVLVDDYTAGGPLEVNHIISDPGNPMDDMMSLGGMDNMDSGDSLEVKEKDLQKIQVGDYIRCVGVIKYNQDMPNVVAYGIKFVDNPNDITKHLLEVIRDSLFLDRNQNSSHVMTGPNTNMPIKQAANDMKNSDFGRLANREKVIIKFLRENTDVNNEVGCNIDDMIQKLKAFKKEEVEQSLQILNSEGLCWQGDDEKVWFANTE